MSDELNPRDIVDQLGQDARVLRQGRLLPDRPLTAAEIAAVRGDLFRYIDKLGLLQGKVAAELGIDANTLGKFRSATAPDDEALARQANDWMERDARRREAQQPQNFVTTRIAEDMRGIVNAAVVTGSMAVIVAPSGSGKSLVMEYLAKRFLGRYLYCGAAMKARAFLRSLAKAVDAPASHSSGDLLAGVIDKLKGTNRPLFLDEAHLLPADVFSVIRTVHDIAGVPIVMAGTVEILGRVDDRADGRGQFASRCITWNLMEGAIDAGGPDGGQAAGRPLFTREEVAAFLDRLHIRIDPDALTMLWSIACLPNHGCLRTIGRIISLLRPAHLQSAAPIGKADVLKAMSLLFGLHSRQMTRLAERQREAMERAA